MNTAIIPRGRLKLIVREVAGFQQNLPAARACVARKQNDAVFAPWGNLCVVKLHREDEGVVSQKSYSIGRCIDRITWDYSITGDRSDQGVLRRNCVAVLEFC